MCTYLAKTEDGGSFKDFVAVKRELATLQEEHLKLRERVQTNPGGRAPSAKASSTKPRINLKLAAQ